MGNSTFRAAPSYIGTREYLSDMLQRQICSLQNVVGVPANHGGHRLGGRAIQRTIDADTITANAEMAPDGSSGRSPAKEAEHSTASTMKTVATKDEFDNIIKTSEILVVVDFYATWCGPCRAIAPKIADLEKQYEGRVLFLKVDVDENEEAAESCGVSAMPTFLFYKKGEKVDEVVGANSSAIEGKIAALV